MTLKPILYLILTIYIFNSCKPEAQQKLFKNLLKNNLKMYEMFAG